MFFADIRPIAAFGQQIVCQPVLIYRLVDRHAACLVLELRALVAVAVKRDVLRRKPDRIAELLRTLLPQLFAQLFAQFESELFVLLNTQSEAAGVNREKTTACN